MRALRAQTRIELLLTVRRGESLLLMLGIPLVLLGFFSSVDVLPSGGFEDPIDFLGPGVMALAVMSTGLVQLAIGTAFERQYGVLKRLGATPLGRPRLLAAKVLSIVVVEVCQVLLLGGAAVALGWRPEARPPAVAAVVLGTIAFASLGLAMAGRFRGELTLAAANGLYLVLLLFGGMLFPLDELPGPVAAVAKVLPSSALAETFVGSMSSGASVPGRAWLVLVVWAVAAPLVAIRAFRWHAD